MRVEYGLAALGDIAGGIIFVVGDAAVRAVFPDHLAPTVSDVGGDQAALVGDVGQIVAVVEVVAAGAEVGVGDGDQPVQAVEGLLGLVT